MTSILNRNKKKPLDAPFYSRATVSTSIKGEKTVGVFEALDLRRFRNPLLMFMLAVRVPRRNYGKINRKNLLFVANPSNLRAFAPND